MAYRIARLPMTLSEKGPPKVFGMGPPKSLIRPCGRSQVLSTIDDDCHNVDHTQRPALSTARRAIGRGCRVVHRL